MDINPQEKPKCTRCGKVVWKPGTPNPVACPHCKSLLWNRERIIQRHGNIYQGRTRQDCNP